MMKRAGTLLLVAALSCATLVRPSHAAKKPRLGVFGVVNGKGFKATNLGRADDPCVMGIYNQTDGVIVFSAIECRPRRRRQGAVRKNYQILVIGCANYRSPGPLVAPSELACPSSGYTEAKTGRFRQPVSMTMWNASSEILPDLTITSPLRMRIDSFDGSIASGVLFGTFDMLGQGATAPAAIQGELQFRFPFRVQ